MSNSDGREKVTSAVCEDSDPDGVVTAEHDGPILRITIDRPHRHNALSAPMVDSFVAILTAAASDEAVRAVHIRGAGADFCSGVDLAGSTAQREHRPRTGALLRTIPLTAHRVVELVHLLHLPVVATVRGWATGLGCNLALAADFTVADAAAVFWEPFLRRGFSADSGSTWLLPRLVGLARAKRMLLLGEQVTAGQAAAWGLIHASAPATELDRITEELLERLAAAPTVAYGLTKQAIAFGQHATLAQSMTQELFDVELSSRTQDFKEGVAAFAERRAPKFQGR
ncbi:enoyl-CoA hydratase/isomerase family protein [Nocardia sp. alder85J]|uniref:enoyl-CoA hydratase/isomerase family protein n=1 Tax=Nocardia sp. alder85J TaxID=2862949 RepID=UPI001CD528D4|nr:enoyl-CoA hydratase-related protein [Nocardia sp. alder85J]MCX4096778.1 enoyl-CoA hydratase-related protein [Nocardia sp. alder85J]